MGFYLLGDIAHALDVVDTQHHVGHAQNHGLSPRRLQHLIDVFTECRFAGARFEAFFFTRPL